MANIKLDNFEYSSDANAQAEYVTNASAGSEITQSQTTNTETSQNWSDQDWGFGQGFKVATTKDIKQFTITFKKSAGATGTLTGYIYSDTGGVPNASLATFSAVAVADLTTSLAEYNFTGTYTPVVGTQYHIVVIWTSGTAGNAIYYGYGAAGSYTDGAQSYLRNTTWNAIAYDLYFKLYQATDPALQSYSEATIKTQGSYALKAVAAITDSLNKTLTHTFASPLDLSGVNTLKLDMRASRTGANVKLGLHDTGGTTTEFTPTIISAGGYETKSLDLSGVSDANKNAIDTFIITPTNADAANTVYLDNFNIYFPALTETFTISDRKSVSPNRLIINSVTITDSCSRLRHITKICLESTTLSDNYNRLWHILRIYSESITASDSFSYSRLLIGIYTETISLSDILNKSRSKMVSELIGLSDNITKVPEVITWGSIPEGNNLWNLVPTSSDIWI